MADTATSAAEAAHQHFKELLEATPVAADIIIDDEGRTHVGAGCVYVDGYWTRPASVGAAVAAIDGTCFHCRDTIRAYTDWLDDVGYAHARLCSAQMAVRAGGGWARRAGAAELYALRAALGADTDADTALAQAALTAAVELRKAAWADKAHPCITGWGLTFGMDPNRAIGPHSPKGAGTETHTVFAYPCYDTLIAHDPACAVWEVGTDRFDDQWFAAVAAAAASIAAATDLGRITTALIVAAGATVD